MHAPYTATRHGIITYAVSEMMDNAGVEVGMTRGHSANMARRFVTTLPATSLSMQLLAGEGLTFVETFARYRHLREEGELMQVYIDHGFGDRRLDEFITPVQ